MLKFFTTFFLIMFISCSSYAQDYSNKAAVIYKGVSGIWFDEETATKMLQDLSTLQTYKLKLFPEYELKIEHQKELYELAVLEIGKSEELAKRWEDAYKDAEKLRIAEVDALRDKLNKKDSWFKSPAFTFSLGILGGSVLAIGLSYALHE